MSQLDVQNILEGIKQGHERLLAQSQQQIQRDQLAQQQKAEEDRISQAKDELNQRANQFDITMKAAQAMHKMQLLKEENDLASNPSTIGNLPGIKHVGTTTDTEGNKYNQFQHPAFTSDDNPTGSFTAPTPETAANIQAKYNATVNAPLYAQQDKELQARLASNKLVAGMNENSRQQIAQEAANSRAMVAAIMANSRVNSAKISAGGGMDEGGDEDNSEFLKGIADGSLSSKDIQGTFGTTKAAKARGARVISQGIQNGVYPLSDTTKQGLTNLTSALSILPLYKQILSGKDDSGNPLNVVDRNRILSEMQGQIGNMTKGIDGMTGQRLNLPVLQKTLNAYLPTRVSATLNMGGYNQAQYDNFIRTVNDQLNTGLSWLPPGQKAIIKARVLHTNLGESTLSPNPPANKMPSGATRGDYGHYTTDDFQQELGKSQ